MYFSLNTFFPMGTSFYTTEPMTAIWGSDLNDIGVHGNAFAIELDVKVMTATANQSGLYFQTTVPIGTLYRDDGTLTTISVDELIKNSTIHQMVDGRFTVNEFIRNPNVMVEIHRNGNTIDWGSIMGEAITFVVIPRASIPLAVTNAGTTSSINPFSLAMTARGNFVVWPKATPAGMALAEKPKRVHQQVEVQHSALSTLLSTKAIRKVPEKGWLGKT